MKTSWQNKWHIWLLILAAVLILTIAGCGENESDVVAGDDAPTIPPAYTLAPDFSSMGVNRASSAAMDQVAPAEALTLPDTETGTSEIQASCSQDNYNHAKNQVGFWNAVLWVNLVVPTWSFMRAIDEDPVQQDDGSWIWSYEVNVFDVLYTVELHGAYVDGQIEWRMYITKPGEYINFLWYRGTSDLAATEGTWTLKNNPTDKEDWIGIEWSRSIASQTWNVQYMNVRVGDPNVGGLIEYGVTGHENYDAFYDICDAEGNCINIESNTTTTAGRVMNEARYGDPDWRLWDENHCDVATP